MEDKQVYVKTVYSIGQEPNIALYKTKKDADDMIAITLKWGLNIASCEIIDNPTSYAITRQGTKPY